MTPAVRRSRFPFNVPALVAAVIAVTDDVAYVALLRSQGAAPPDTWVEPVFVSYIAAIGVAAIGGMLLLRARRDAAARIVLAAACGGSAALGFVGIFSIGVPLLIAAVLLYTAMRAAHPNSGRGLWVATAVATILPVIAVVVLVLLIG